MLTVTLAINGLVIGECEIVNRGPPIGCEPDSDWRAYDVVYDRLGVGGTTCTRVVHQPSDGAVQLAAQTLGKIAADAAGGE